MPTTKTAVFTSSGNWTCPAGVTAVWATMVGGGGATCGHFSQGGGSGELVTGRPMSVTPGNVYSVVVGSGGAKSSYGVRPVGQSASTFNGFNALGAGLSTTGGGAGSGGIGGGIGGRFASDNGDDPRGVREAAHYGGGGGGSISGSYMTAPNSLLPFSGVNGGVLSLAGLPYGFGSNSGGAGAGAIWGGTNGANDYVNHAPPDPGNKSADPTHYGAGAGGPGNTPDNDTGGNGAPGLVTLMWSA